MSRRHTNKGRYARRLVSPNSDAAKARREQNRRANGQALSMDVAEGGLVIEDPAVAAKFKELYESGADSDKVHLTMARRNGGPLPANGVVKATEDDAFIITGIEADDPANPPDYQVGDVVRPRPDGPPEKVGIRDAFRAELRDGAIVLNGDITNPDVVKLLREADDPEDMLTRMLRAGSDALGMLPEGAAVPKEGTPEFEDMVHRAVEKFREDERIRTTDAIANQTLVRAAMASDPLTPAQRWGTPRMSDEVVGTQHDPVRRYQQMTGSLPLRPGTDKRAEAQAHPERWKLAPDHVCPRCGRDVPEEGHKGEYRGALSRTDNATEVCSACGLDEAYEEPAGALRPQSEWPVPPREPRPSDLPPGTQLAGHGEPWEDIRGGNRPPRQMTPTPKELPDLRLHLMEKWLPGGIFERALLQDGGTVASVVGPGVSRHERAVASMLDSEFQRKLLAEASLWWVRDEMVDLVTAATKTTPDDLLATEVELPANQDAGMVLLGKPYVGTDAFNTGMQVQVDVLCWARARAAMGTIPCISLVMYRYFEMSGGLSRRDLEDAVTSGAIYDAKIQRIIKNASSGEMAGFLTGGSWVYVGRTDWPLASTVTDFDAFGEGTAMLSDMQKASMIEDRRFFASFCLLVNHKLSAIEEEPGPRHVVRRMERDLKVTPEKAREISKVKIVRLRELRRKAGESAEDHEKRKVDWKYRWYSSGHWAWRWCGPRNAVPRARRRVFVSGSIKGPRDLPIVFKETIRVWTR